MEVSERTILRDMEGLGSAGVPIVSERGVGGGWELMEGYGTSVTALNDAEVQSLFMTKPSRLLTDLGLDRASDAALIKLLSLLPGFGASVAVRDDPVRRGRSHRAGREAGMEPRADAFRRRGGSVSSTAGVRNTRRGHRT
jgi:predicted DNA-binding transcriptional regulator YafY